MYVLYGLMDYLARKDSNGKKYKGKKTVNNYNS